jgi:DNA-binding XRE family transcriptional regulator
MSDIRLRIEDKHIEAFVMLVGDFDFVGGWGMSIQHQKRRTDARDAEIGRRLRVRRLQKGLTRTELGELIGVTFQQLQKYESGVNRVAAGRLRRIAEPRAAIRYRTSRRDYRGLLIAPTAHKKKSATGVPSPLSDI